MAHFWLSLLAPVGQAREISGALRTLARRARLARGCTLSEVYASVEDQNRLFLEEKWTEAEDLARYIRSDDFGQVLTLIEMAAEPPVVEFRFAGETRGLDYVTEVRSSAGPAVT